VFCPSSVVRLVLLDEEEHTFASYDTGHHGVTYSINKGLNRIEVTIPKLKLRAGKYSLNLILMSIDNLDRFLRADNIVRFTAESEYPTSAPLIL
jgi:hypothetical protein